LTRSQERAAAGWTCGDGGDSVTRLLRSALAPVRLREDGLTDGASPLPGQLTRLCTALVRQRPPRGLPSGWHSVLDAADRADGQRLHLDLDTALPPGVGTAVRLNTLASQPGSAFAKSPRAGSWANSWASWS
jgi:hypothetical protein